jgi:hypothetical protein
MTTIQTITLTNPDAAARVAGVTLTVLAGSGLNPHNRQHGYFHAVYSMTRRDGTTSTMAGSPFPTEEEARGQAEAWAAGLVAKNPAIVRS